MIFFVNRTRLSAHVDLFVDQIKVWHFPIILYRCSHAQKTNLFEQLTGRFAVTSMPPDLTYSYPSNLRGLQTSVGTLKNR
jgi:hypothetical protein